MDPKAVEAYSAILHDRVVAYTAAVIGGSHCPLGKEALWPCHHEQNLLVNLSDVRNNSMHSQGTDYCV